MIKSLPCLSTDIKQSKSIHHMTGSRNTWKESEAGQEVESNEELI